MGSASIVYIVISSIFVMADLYIGWVTLKKGNEAAKYLGLTCILAAFVSVAYFFSILFTDYRRMSTASSLYFIGIDWTLVFMTKFIVTYTNRKPTKFNTGMYEFCKLYAIAESVLFIFNIFYEIEVSYIPRFAPVAHYTYDLMPIYRLHLLFTYSLVVMSVGLLIIRSHRAPMQYKNKFIFPVLAIVVIVGVNGVFLFIKDNHFWNYIDVSVLGYSFALLVFYWSAFIYSENDMIKGLSQMIFDNLTQGIVLFDYEQRLVMRNDTAEKLLSFVNFADNMTAKDFLSQCGITPQDEEKYTVQFYAPMRLGSYPVRCDYTRMTSKKGKVIGNAFLFTDARLETDLLTGFENWDSYARTESAQAQQNVYPTTAVSFDINNLSQINAEEGKEEGDKYIRTLAQCMKDIFPHGTYFIRGTDAHLIAICFENEEKAVSEYIKNILTFVQFSLQYGMSEVKEDETNTLSAVSRAERSMRIKKLLDKNSVHSRLLTSLVQALQESDNDTEAHVQRTQKMGAKLAEKLGFTDIQQSQLSLLCLLHDIGKIGIPLEILNKPGKLSEDEWNMLKSHVEKGYQIACSSRELSDISGMIRHHHERWDGKGYPDGLGGENIPLLSRVISVVDAYDAMVNNRSYRRAMSPENAQAELIRCSGTQFDPQIVTAFTEMLSEFPEYSLGENVGAETFVQSYALNPFSESSDNPKVTHEIIFARYVADKNSRIVQINNAFTQLTGYTPQDIDDNVITQLDLIPADDRDDYMRTILERMKDKSTAFIEHRLMKKDGTTAYVFCLGKLYYDSAVMEERTEVFVADASSTYTVRTISNGLAAASRQKRKKEKRVSQRTAKLTYAEFADETSQKIADTDYNVMLLVIGTDKFSEYSSLHGKKAGEDYLILLSHTLNSSLRYEDIACRQEDDKFIAALFFKKCVSEISMRNRASQIFDKLNLTLNKYENGTSVSMGVSIQSDTDSDYDSLYDRADRAFTESVSKGTCRLTIL